MSTMSDQDFIKQMTRVAQIIVGSLIAGVVFFLVIAATVDVRPERPVAGAAAIPATGGQDDALDRILIAMVVVVAGLGALFSFVVPHLITARAGGRSPRRSRRPQCPGSEPAPAVPQTEISKLTMVYHTQMIVGAAMNEGRGILRGHGLFDHEKPDRTGRRPAAPGRDGRAVSDGRSDPARWVDIQQEKLRQDDMARSSF